MKFGFEIGIVAAEVRKNCRFPEMGRILLRVSSDGDNYLVFQEIGLSRGILAAMSPEGSFEKNKLVCSSYDLAETLYERLFDPILNGLKLIAEDNEETMYGLTGFESLAKELIERILLEK